MAQMRRTETPGKSVETASQAIAPGLGGEEGSGASDDFGEPERVSHTRLRSPTRGDGGEPDDTPCARGDVAPPAAADAASCAARAATTALAASRPSRGLVVPSMDKGGAL